MKLLKKCKVLLPPFIVAMIVLTVFFIKKIYPFGNLTVDYYDMAQQISAFYLHIYDVLHGEKALFLDPYTALSVNMAMSTSGCSHLSIFNLFFLFVKRSMILESLSFFLMMKMMLMSATMYIYLHGSKRIGYLTEIIFSVGYGLCGFVMVLYVTIQWMDIAVLFPLIMLFMQRTVSTGKSVAYVITLTLSLIASYYITFMILIYIVLIVGLDVCAEYLFERNKEKDRRQFHLTALFLETVISIAMSSFILIPQLKQTLMSARFNNENGGGILNMYMGIINSVTPQYTTRWFSLLGLSFSFAVIAVGIFKNRKEKKLVFVAAGTLFIMLTELFIESVNLIWHFGSYVQYPIRNGFIIYFAVAVTAASFLEREKIKLSGFSHIVIAAVILFTALALFMYKYGTMSGIPVRIMFHFLAGVMAFTFVAYVIILAIYNGKLLGMVPAILFAELILYCFIFIGRPSFVTGYSEEPEQEGEYIRICNQMMTAFHIYPDDEYDYLFERIKNPDESMNSNYGLCLRRPALSNWTHLLDPELVDTAKKLGYSAQFTRLLDAGGTVFSDALLSVENVITYVPQNEELYEKIAEADIQVDHVTGLRKTYYYYKTKYSLPFGVVCQNIDDINFATGDQVDIYNGIYHAIKGSNKEKPIAKWVYNNDLQLKRYEGRNGNIRKMQHVFPIIGKKALYYFADQIDTDDYNTIIKVNDETIQIPSIKEWDNTLYPAHFNNNAVFLGVFDTENVDISVEFMDNTPTLGKIESTFSPNIMSIDLDMLSELCSYTKDTVNRNAEKREYSFSCEVDDNESLLIPISYDKGYEAKVNGNKVTVESVGAMFQNIPLSAGNNIIRVTFMPDGMKPGAVISSLAFIIFFCWLVLIRRYGVDIPEIPYLDKVYMAGFLAVMIVMYFVPIIYGVSKWIV